MASNILIPTATNVNVVATPSTDPTNPYYTKKNLNEKTGSFLTQATVLVYDDIKRAQGIKLTNNLTQAQLDAFDYDEFAGNILWFMDELVGMESDWKQNASPGIVGNTAYGYVQFTEPAVTTLAVKLYNSHLKRFNERKDTRDWQPWGIPLGTEISTPYWVSSLKKHIDNGTYKHRTQMNLLTYDKMLALALIHLHWPESKDSDFVLVAQGDIDAAKRIYIRDHHKKAGGPDAKTLLRLNVTGGGFFQLHTIPVATLLQTAQKIPIVASPALIAQILLQQIKESRYQKIIDTIKGWFGW